MKGSVPHYLLARHNDSLDSNIVTVMKKLQKVLLSRKASLLFSHVSGLYATLT